MLYSITDVFHPQFTWEVFVTSFSRVSLLYRPISVRRERRTPGCFALLPEAHSSATLAGKSRKRDTGDEEIRPHQGCAIAMAEPRQGGRCIRDHKWQGEVPSMSSICALPRLSHELHVVNASLHVRIRDCQSRCT